MCKKNLRNWIPACAGMTVYTGMMFLFFIPIAFAQNLFQHSNQLMNIDEQIEPYTDSIILRNRVARMDKAQLLKSALSNQSLDLNLFEDVDFRATLKKSRSSSSGSVFMSGSLEYGGHVTLFISKEGIVRGEVHSPKGVYTIRTSKGERGSQNVTIRQIDTSKLPPIDHGAMSFHSDDWIPAFKGLKGPQETFQLYRMTANGVEEESSDKTVDILVVYTPSAEAHEGGKEEIEATIRAEIEKTNQALINSGLSHRKIRLVAMEQVDYTQSTDYIGNDLQVLRDKRGAYNDPTGILDEVHTLREKYGADLGHLFVEQAIGGCGIANRYDLYDKRFVENACADNSTPDECVVQEQKRLWRYKSFSVFAIPEGCRIQYSFTHELGHNFGLYHERYVESYLSLTDPVNFPVKSYGFGYVNQNFSRSRCARTIMAYGDQCVDEGSDYSPRQLMFSNPDVELGSEDVGFDPAGVDGEEWTIDLDGPVNAARAIDEVWDIVANLYPSAPFLFPCFPLP